MHRAPLRASSARRTYEFAGYIADIQCGLTLRCQTSTTYPTIGYYKDVARKRRLPCPNGGNKIVRTDLVRQQFGELLQGLCLPEHWRDEIRRKMVEAAGAVGLNREAGEREKERLKLKRTRVLKQHRDGYIDDAELHGEIAAIELALRDLESPEVDGVKLDEVIAAGERIPGIAALWNVATPEERREMVMLLLETGGLYYDLEQKAIAAIRPRPAFLPVLRMLEGVVEYDQARGFTGKKKLATGE